MGWLWTMDNLKRLQKQNKTKKHVIYPSGSLKLSYLCRPTPRWLDPHSSPRRSRAEAQL